MVLLAYGVVTLSVMFANTPEKGKSPFARWEKTIAAMEKADRLKPPPREGVFFCGSSSIRLWKLESSFPDRKLANRGFGGSQIADSTHFAPHIILPYAPHTIVLYAGDNDIAAGKSPEQVKADFAAFVATIHAKLPKTRILFLAIKPSILRWKLIDKVRKANTLIEAVCKNDKRLTYVDVATPMLGEDGKPKPSLFVVDGLHLSAEGYKLWTSVLNRHLDSAKKD